MDNDDETVGRVLSRREALALLGSVGVGLLATRASGQAETDTARGRTTQPRLPSCVVRPQQTEGPYFVDGTLNRSDIRSDPGTGALVAGAALALEFRVSRVGSGTCAPLAGALVDVWQCDALGVYSAVRDTGGRFDTTGQKFLRGHQTTDAAGIARFTTVYPGWYEGRAVHIHFKIRAAATGGRAMEFTSQLYFDDAETAKVLARAPYAQKGTAGWVRNDRDGIFRRGGRDLMVATTVKDAGYAGAFDIGLQM